MAKIKTYIPYPSSVLWSREEAFAAALLEPELFFWTTLDGQTIEIKDLRTSHIENIIKHVKGKSNATSITTAMNKELKRRKIEVLKKTKAGKILYDK